MIDKSKYLYDYYLVTKGCVEPYDDVFVWGESEGEHYSDWEGQSFDGEYMDQDIISNDLVVRRRTPEYNLSIERRNLLNKYENIKMENFRSSCLLEDIK